MATTKPRITVTLSHKQHDVLKAISENSGQSMSTFIHELLEQTLPVLERMAESFRKIRVVQDEQKKRIAEDLDQAQTAVEPVLAQVIDQFNLLMDRVENAAGVSPSHSAPSDGDGLTPAGLRTPVTNRGVTTPPQTPSKPRRSKASEPIQGKKVFSKNGGV